MAVTMARGYPDSLPAFLSPLSTKLYLQIEKQIHDLASTTDAFMFSFPKIWGFSVACLEVRFGWPKQPKHHCLEGIKINIYI